MVRLAVPPPGTTKRFSGDADNEHHPLTVHILDLQIESLGDPQTTGIHHDGAHARHGAALDGQQTLGFIRIEYDRQLLAFSSPQQLQSGPRLLNWLGLVVEVVDWCGGILRVQ